MDWLKRATREFSETPQGPAIKTIETPVSEVLKVPHPDVSKNAEAAPTVPSGACATCAHYRAKPGQTPDGWCVNHRTETWGAHTGGCTADWTPAAPAARELERRRAAVVARLEADPALRYSFDVQGASPTAPANGTVSVMLGLRTTAGSIVTGELHIPADRWPGIAMFNEHLRMAAEGLPS
ncbi:MAG: hypothetical protein M0038_10940 [Pseudomonadota bacterium]|jgi:hypothetical protein|nr:hypothetical protein [Pseudomonadota bacterium]